MEATPALPDPLREFIRDSHDISRGLLWGKWLVEAHGEPYTWKPLPQQIGWLNELQATAPGFITQACQSKDIEFLSTELASSFTTHGLKESDLEVDGLIQDICMAIYVVLNHAAGAVKGSTDIDKGTFLLARKFRTSTWIDAISIWRKKKEQASLINQLYTAITDNPNRSGNDTTVQSSVQSYASAAMRGMGTPATPISKDRRPPSDPRPHAKRVSFASGPAAQAPGSTTPESRPSMATGTTVNDTTVQSSTARPDTRKRRKDPRPNSNIFIRGLVVPEVLKGDIAAYLKHGLNFGDAIQDDFKYTRYESGNIRIVCPSTEAATKVIRRKAQNLRHLPIHMNYWAFVSQTSQGRHQQIEQQVINYLQRINATPAPENVSNATTSEEASDMEGITTALVNKRRRDQDTTPAQNTITSNGVQPQSNTSIASADVDNDTMQEPDTSATKRHKDLGVAERKDSSDGSGQGPSVRPHGPDSDAENI